MNGPTEWLDTETQACLQKAPPDKLAPPIVDGYSLVLIARGPDDALVERAIQRICGQDLPATRECPLLIRRNLSMADALIGQFELVCADSISVFLRDDVASSAEPSYLRNLYESLRSSEEFAPVMVRLPVVPDGEDGLRFLRQFFGQCIGISSTHRVPRKKARIMAHWGAKLGVPIEIDEKRA